MSKATLLFAVAVCAATLSVTAGTGAHLVDGTAVVAAGATNAVSEKWLDTSSATGVKTGVELPGAGIVRAMVYTIPAGVTNGVIRFYAYDAGVKRPLYANVSIPLPGTGSCDMGTNVIYSGKIRVEVYQKAYTNAACTWAWAAIVE